MSKRTRTDFPLPSAQNISTSILVHILCFAGEATLSARLHAVCRHWNTISTTQLRCVWRLAYTLNWHHDGATSYETRCTSKDRCRRRTRLERSWATGKCRVRQVSPSPQTSRQHVFFARD